MVKNQNNISDTTYPKTNNLKHALPKNHTLMEDNAYFVSSNIRFLMFREVNAFDVHRMKSMILNRKGAEKESKLAPQLRDI